MAEDSEYLLELIREEAGFTLYRGREPGNPVPILALAVTVEQPSLLNLRRLEHEWSLAGELDPAWALKPLALTRLRGRATLIMNDPGATPLDQVIRQCRGQPVNVARLLSIAMGLAAALSQVHRQGLIHKDVKPSNVLVNDVGHLWLTGFGMASRLPREHLPPVPPEIIAGTLAYMSPEQTGRMNRSIDSRSDLYSLGVTLYELFTGSVPFAASDPMEWVHCHIARLPVPPCERASSVPPTVSAIVMKLLAKTAEERYQTAVGLERDLERCLKEWESCGRVSEFALAEFDTSDRLLIPEKLYGRASEIGTLLQSFERVAGSGRPELVLASGYSGIGKSSVVNELHKPLVLPRGLFASGKFDQYKRDIPYATLARALQSLIRPILARSEGEVDRWRDALQEALGLNGQLMADLLPELKLIIGEQQPVPELPLQDAQSRFQLVFRRFIGVFTREQPLALFLDDLQWLDAATLDLMESLLTHPDVKNLMLIGAYRSNEVAPGHPLMRKLEAIRQAGAIVHDIALAPLTRGDLEELLGDTLNCERQRASPLAELIEARTSGNPFFAIQFLSALFEEGLLVFDHAHAQWTWDLKRILDKGYTDNVVDLLMGKLSRLPIGTQKALQQLACLGNSADFAMLHMVYQDESEEMHAQLWDAVRSGLISRSEDAYRFLHDRVQEAAYSTIAPDQRAQEHLRIGMLLAARTSPDKLEEGIFEAVNQLNRGAHLITSVAERQRVAQLNLVAGRRAKVATAYASALKYLHAGRAMVTDAAWHDDYDLIFAIEHLLAECELLTADMPAAQSRLSMLVDLARTAHDAALVARLRMTLYNMLGSDRGVAVFIEYQRSNGEDWSPRPTYEQASQEYARIGSLIGTRQIAGLVDLPLITDSDVLDVLDVFTEAVISAMITDENLLAFVLCRMVAISLEHGNSDASCFAYVSLGMLVGPYFGDYETGFQFGRLGYELVEKHGLQRYQARVYLRFGNCVSLWRRHVKEGRELVRRAFDAANRLGDLTFAAYSCHGLNTNRLATGDPLAQVQRDAEAGLEFAEKARFGRVIDMIVTQLALIRSLRGQSTTFGSFDSEQFDELQFEHRLSRNPVLALPECWYWVRKLQGRFFAGDYDCALHAASNAARLLWTSHSYFEVAEYHFYSALARAGAFESATESLRDEHFAALLYHYRQLVIWAENCPENFENRAALLAAEIARIEGRFLDAEQWYEKAIHSAHANGFTNNEAVANEAAGRFYAMRGLEKIARTYLRDARHCYLTWGADGKVRQLDQLYPNLRDETLAPGSIAAPTELLDLATMIKVSQSISSEIVLTKLIETLLRTAVENAGAGRGLLILLRGGAQGNEPRIEAEAISHPGQIDVTVGQAAIRPSDLPQSALHFVIRTRELVLLDDASVDVLYSTDEYVMTRRSRSVLCLPIVKRAKLVGVLYLENDLAPFVFTAARVTVLQLLASQAAISLENATLYADLQRSEAFLAQGQRISHTGSFGWNASSGEYYWSDENYRILEYDRDVLGSVENAVERMHPDDRDAVRMRLDAALREKKIFESEHRLLMPDGRIKHVHVTGQAVNTGNLDFVGAVRDITERKQAEESLREALTNLARSNRATTMGELTASLAHEINQPITAAIAYASACLRWLDLDKPDLGEARMAAARAVSDGRRAARIISRIRVQFEKGALDRNAIDASEVVRETVDLLRGEAARHAISICTELADDLPMIIGDRTQLQQVAMNLIVNSIEAMKDIDGIREMFIQSRRLDDTQILVSVSDTGIGVLPQFAEQIFDPFFTTKPHGTGMGLRISRSIVESHGGSLWVSSVSPRGATFQFTLPVAVTTRTR